MFSGLDRFDELFINSSNQIVKIHNLNTFEDPYKRMEQDKVYEFIFQDYEKVRVLAKKISRISLLDRLEVISSKKKIESLEKETQKLDLKFPDRSVIIPRKMGKFIIQ